jgi:hypothetical protein
MVQKNAAIGWRDRKIMVQNATLDGNPLNAPPVPAKQDAIARGWYVPLHSFRVGAVTEDESHR